MGFLDKKKNEEWIDGTPESFKIWFWVRLAVCLFLMYTGGELGWKWIQGEVPWYAMATGVLFILVGIVFFILDLIRYLRLRRALKERDEDDPDRTADTSALGTRSSLSRPLDSDDHSRTADTSALGTRPSLSRSLASDVSGSPERSDNQAKGVVIKDPYGTSDNDKPTSISGFARYVVKDEEGDSDDEV